MPITDFSSGYLLIFICCEIRLKIDNSVMLSPLRLAKWLRHLAGFGKARPGIKHNGDGGRMSTIQLLCEIRNMEITEEYLKTYFGKNSDYYIDQWKEYKNGKVISFKPYAFIFGLLWFLYRKMYGIALLIILVVLVEGILEVYLLAEILETGDTRRIIDFSATFLLASFCGMFGNYLYMKSSERKIKNIISKELSEDERLSELEKKGGTSWVFLIILVLIIVTIAGVNNFT